MPISEITLSDFSGGFFPRLSAVQFSERQWAALKGMVIESPTEVRSQWACQKIGAATGFVQIESCDGRLVGRKADSTFWWTDYPPSALTAAAARAIVWTQITGIAADPSLRLVCRVPLREVDSTGFREGLLINGRDRSSSAYAVHFAGGVVGLKEWATMWPAGASGATVDVMPPANRGVMWGDFLVLGDIRWMDDESAAPSATNNKPHEHALWFSLGGKLDSFDALDVEFMSFYSGPSTRTVLEMVPIDAGLLAFTGAGIALLRGDGDEHDFEPLRTGLGPVGGMSFWAETGSVAWVDKAGAIWHTNGEEFANLTALDIHLERTTAAGDGVEPVGEYLLVSRQGQLFCFRAFESDGAWTEFVTPDGVVEGMLTLGDQLYFLGAGGQVWRYNRRGTGETGLIDGVAVELTVATRTLGTEGGHEQSYWHRAALRAGGTGTVVRGVLRPGPALDALQPTLVYPLAEPVTARYEQVVPGHGPSLEASVEWVFTGDVRVEQVTVWAQEGSPSR